MLLVAFVLSFRLPFLFLPLLQSITLGNTKLEVPFLDRIMPIWFSGHPLSLELSISRLIA